MAGYGGAYDLGHPDYIYNMPRNSRRPAAQRFDEYYRCYSLVMAPGAERPDLDFGSKIILPPSALDKVSKLHVQWPLLMEMINGEKGSHSHAGVLEFIAEEGRAYIPQWMMQTLGLDIGDMIQIRTTSLELAKMVKLQPQSVNFLEISDPKAVLEKAFRNFAALTKGDVFNFEYNDERYSVAVLDVKPATDKMGVSMIETDVSVEFAPPVGYVEPSAAAAASASASGNRTPAQASSGSTPIPTPRGSMAQAIDYEAIARLATTAPTNFRGEGQRVAKRGGGGGSGGSSRNGTPKTATPAPQQQQQQQQQQQKKKPGEAGATSATRGTTALPRRHVEGAPAPLRLPPNQLFFGYEIKPVKTEGDKERESEDAKRPHFSGQGQSLRGAVRKKGEGDDKGKAPDKGPSGDGRKMDGRR